MGPTAAERALIILFLIVVIVAGAVVINEAIAHIVIAQVDRIAQAFGGGGGRAW